MLMRRIAKFARRVARSTSWSAILSVTFIASLSAQTKGKTVLIGRGVDLEWLNPYWHNTTASYAVWHHFLEPLAEYDFAKKRYVGVLAESWTGNDKAWIFKLQKNVRFHNGSWPTPKDKPLVGDYAFKDASDTDNFFLQFDPLLFSPVTPQTVGNQRGSHLDLNQASIC